MLRIPLGTVKRPAAAALAAFAKGVQGGGAGGKVDMTTRRRGDF